MFTLKLIEKAKAQLEAAAAGLKAKNIEVDQVLRLGNPYHGISVMITEQDVDLVVMGTSDRSKLEEIIAGSNTEKVIRHAHCLVLTVHARTGKRDFKNIVYATALVEDEKPFAELIINTQKIFDSTLHIVRVNTPTNFQPDSAVKFVMQNFARKSNLKNYTLNVYNDYTEEQGIIHFAESINADLIAIATHGRTGFAHTLAGSIAEEVASHSRRPVLTFVNK
jgi:nucleotide-binding universal stress UspA family protein